ncbi:MAG: lytic transglycosylase domain-containing protein [Verrucomicrobiota bacterium]|nr:lytic transglycosylase domain-containing protein [Verrucomicrobiota bacterium]
MARFLSKLIICLLLAGAAGLVYLSMRSGDSLYTLQEWISPGRFQQHDALIRTVAAEHQLDPMLVKALVWRESRFDAQKIGTAGERGLMQVSEKAAGEWARETKVENFRVEELFDPKTNLEAGTWYLRRAIEHWQNQANPLPFALAEYNAGASRALRWAGGADTRAIAADTFLANIDFPGTRKYVDSIIARYEFYKRRGQM